MPGLDTTKFWFKYNVISKKYLMSITRNKQLLKNFETYLKSNIPESELRIQVMADKTQPKAASNIKTVPLNVTLFLKFY